MIGTFTSSHAAAAAGDVLRNGTHFAVRSVSRNSGPKNISG